MALPRFSGRVVRRRSSVAIAAGIALGALLMGGSLRSDTPRQHRNILLVYVGAEDCAPCRAWQRGMGAEFRSSFAFSRLSYREIKAPTPFELLSDEIWSPDLRSYRARIDGTMAVPMWLVIADGEVVSQSFGASQWARTVLPTLSLLIN
jgi:hypothetical protein